MWKIVAKLCGAGLLAWAVSEHLPPSEAINVLAMVLFLLVVIYDDYTNSVGQRIDRLNERLDRLESDEFPGFSEHYVPDDIDQR